MRTVIQRVSKAEVEVSGERISQIDSGYLVLLGVAGYDTLDDVDYIVRKISGLRLFGEKFNSSIEDFSGQILLVSQFTLLADTRKGRRPDWNAAAGAETARKMYNEVRDRLAERGIPVQEGRFGVEMKVSLVNDGPVTIIIDSRQR